MKYKLIILFFVFNFSCFAKDIKIGVIGDSNSLDKWELPRTPYHALIAKKFNVKIINDSRGARTTNELFDCTQKMLSYNPDLDVIIISLGLCDGACHFSFDTIFDNYDSAIKLIKTFNIPILLNRIDISGFKWHSIEYSDDFSDVFVAIKLLHPEVILFNYIDYKMTTDPSYFSGGLDPVHPNDKGHQEIAERIEKVLIEELHFNKTQ